MSELSITPYFPFRRINIVKQTVALDTSKATIQIVPDRRFKPICHLCGKPVGVVHSWSHRLIRDLNISNTQVWLNCSYRKLLCTVCKRISIEDLELFDPYLRVTRRLAYYVYQLCRIMTVTEVATHLNIDWKTVKAIDKKYLGQDYGQPNYDGLSTLAVDEIAVRRGHNYLTVVLDYLSGRVVFVGKDRKAKTLEGFFNRLKPKQRRSIEAVAMDMWDPFIKAVKKNCHRPRSCLIFSML
jgi:transposase